MMMRWQECLRVALLSALAYSGIFTIPLWLGGFADRSGMDAGVLAGVASVQLVCSMVAGLALSTLWASAPLARALITGAVLVLFANLGCVYAKTLEHLIFLRGVSGCGEGVLLAGLNLLISRSPQPDRGFALSQTAVGLFGILLFALVPPLMQTWGIAVLFVFVAGVAVLTFLVVILPGLEKRTVERVRAAESISLSVFLGRFGMPLIGLSIVFIGCQGAWSYIERMGVHQHLDLVTIGRFLVAGQLISLLAPSAATWLSRKSDHRCSIAVGLVISGLSVSLAVQSGPWLCFMLAAATFQFGTLFIVTSYYAYLAECDPSGRAAGAAPAFLNLGSAVGPIAVAWALTVENARSPFLPLAVTAVVCYLVAALMLIYGRPRPVSEQAG